MPIVVAKDLSKTFRIADKRPGLLGTARHFFRRRYRRVEAVKQVSFTIEPGEIVGFLGPNGAGKTTTLKLLTGLIHPTSGIAEVAGCTPFKRQRGFLTDITLVMGNKQQLIWDLPVLDSLRINAEVYDIGRSEFHKRVDELASMLRLDAQLTQPVRKLSLGERMKAELMAALLHRPSVLFLDEPTLGLDVNAQTAVREFLRQYNREHGATVLLTSHYMADITALCPRVLLIHQGSLMYDGSLNSLVQKWTPHRQVTLELTSPLNGRDLSRYGEVESIEGCVVRLLVPRERLTNTVAQLMRDLEPADLTIGDPPVEEVIGRLFRQEIKT